jgi:hypothetical protein
MSQFPSDPTRREFAKAAVAAAVAPVLTSLAACAPGQPEPSSSPSPAPSPTPTAGGAPVAPSAPPQRRNEQQRDPQAQELTEALKARYRDRLTDEQWETVREGIEGNLRAAKQMRDFPLPITTEPAFVFRAYRGGER